MREETRQISPWSEILKIRPKKNEEGIVTELGDGTVVVAVPFKKTTHLKPPLSWVFSSKPELSTRLDGLGTEMWRLCDGHNTVENIVDAFAAAHRLTFHEARVAVTSHIMTLLRRKVLFIEQER